MGGGEMSVDERTGRTVASLLKEVRRTALFRERVPMEAGIGWPIPIRRGWRVDLLLPLYGFGREDGRTRLYPPFGTVTVDQLTGVPRDYVDLRATRPWRVASPPEPIGRFPHDAVRGPAGAYLKARARLLECYDELCASMRNDTPFGSEREFGELLGRLVEPALLPYYRVLGPAFYERYLGPGPIAS